VSQTGGTFSGGSACNGQTTISLATANSSRSWGSGATQIGPGTTVYLCGALTTTAGGVILNIQNSGTSGNPIIILFDLNATAEAPYFAGDGNLNESSCGDATCGGIEANGQNYIIIDGGTNGMMENTANGSASVTCQSGSACAYQANSVGVYMSGTGETVRNLTIQHIYDQCGAQGSSCADTGGQFTEDVGISGYSAKACNNTLKDARSGIAFGGKESQGPTITLTCAANTFQAGMNLFANTLDDHVWQMSGAGAGNVNIWINEFLNWTNWAYPLSYHLDGIIYWGVPGGPAPTGYIYDNLFNGDLGAGAGTAYIYCTNDGASDNSGSICYDYRNIIAGTGSMLSTAGTTAPFYLPGRSTGANTGPDYFYFNTIIGGLNTFNDGDSTASTPFTFIGNILDPKGAANAGSYFYVQFSSNPPFSILTVQGNAYNNNARSFESGTQAAWQWGTAGPAYGWTSASGTPWTTACTAGGGLGGCDSTSTYPNTFAYNSNWMPTSGSWTGIAPNETSLASTLVGINMAPPTKFGVGATCCGATLPSTGAWDAGAVPSGSATTAGPPAPTGLSAVVN
jgi:hypothetical protein